MSSRSPAFPRPCTIAWIMLIGLSLITYRLGAVPPGRTLMLVVLMLALLKGQLVVNYYMGLRRVRVFWRIVMAGYLLIIGGSIALAYFIA